MLKTLKKPLVILTLIIIFGSFLRLYNLGEYSFSADEFLDVNSAYGYHKTGEWQAWDFNLEKPAENDQNPARDSRAWIYKWQTAELFNFLPPTEAVSRLTSALWGILSILIIYFVAWQFTKSRAIGLLSAFFLAISPEAIHFSRMLRMYAMFFPIFLLFSWLTFSTLEKKYSGKNSLLQLAWEKIGLNLLFLFPALIIGLLSLHLHLLTANMGFILLGYFLILSLMKFKKDRKLDKYFYFLLIILAIGILGKIFFPSQVAMALAGLGFTSHISYTIKVFGDFAAPGIAFLLTLLGSVFLFKKNLRKESIWLSVSFWGILFLSIFFWDRNAGNQYIFFVQSFKLILLSTGIYFLATYLKDNLKENKKKLLPTVLLISIVFLPNWFLFTQTNNPYNQTSESATPQYRKIFTYIKKKSSTGDVFITRNFRNFYFSGEDIKVYNLGGEVTKEKLTLERLNTILAENPSGWIILSENDRVFVSKEAAEFMIKNLEKISNSEVRGDVEVYHWGN